MLFIITIGMTIADNLLNSFNYMTLFNVLVWIKALD